MKNQSDTKILVQQPSTLHKLLLSQLSSLQHENKINSA